MKVPKRKALRIAIMFFAVGGWGLALSYMFGGSLILPIILFLSLINLAMGGVFVVVYKKAKK